MISRKILLLLQKKRASFTQTKIGKRTKQDCSAFEETVFFKNIENRIFTKLIAVKKDEVRYLSFTTIAKLKPHGIQYHWKMRGGAELLVWKWDKSWIVRNYSDITISPLINLSIQCHHVPAQSPSKNKRYPIIAQFFPYVLRSPSNPYKIAQMTVQPSGQPLFDEMILSLLIVERKRKKLARR